MNFIKENWKNILLVLFCVMFLSTCAKKNNYRRKLAIYGDATAFRVDSLEGVISQKTALFNKSYDSILRINERLTKEIDNLNKDIEIYKEQNNKLHNKKVTVVIKENKE